jgi:hypothetical protein
MTRIPILDTAQRKTLRFIRTPSRPAVRIVLRLAGHVASMRINLLRRPELSRILVSALQFTHEGRTTNTQRYDYACAHAHASTLELLNGFRINLVLESTLKFVGGFRF